ncbi:MAG: subclass B1 metallo-beta-lactamase [Saprospiraceae bacterium]
MAILLIFSTSVFFFQSCKSTSTLPAYDSETLDIQSITKNTFVHISYLPTESWGLVACNGMIFKSKDEAVIFDTPTNDEVSNELIDWVEKKLKCTVKAVVINHFHVDCLGGLAAFHKRGIPSYANEKTIALAKADNSIIPQRSFTNQLDLTIGNQAVITDFLGGGHTFDNTISYVPSEKAMFGGCMIKAIGAGKGNLADADVEEWSNTVAKIKNKYPDVKYIVPGHGKMGGVELLDYTIEKFKEK